MSAYVSSDELKISSPHFVSRRVVWSAQPSDEYPSGRATSKVTLENLLLPANWYQVKVWTSEEEAVVAGRARLLENRRAELRIRMERAGKKCFRKTFKIAEPLSSLSIALEGEQSSTALSRIELHPLNKFAVGAFLAVKALRFAVSHKGRVNWKTSWAHLLAALHPRANFAFRGRYDRPGNESYSKWRAVHEHPNSGASAARALADSRDIKKARLLLLVADRFDPALTKKKIEQSLIGSEIDVRLTDAAALKDYRPRPDKNDFVLPIDYEGVFPRGAIERLILKLSRNDQLAALFADSDFLTGAGIRRDPRLKPPWDQELLWCTDYIRAPLIVRWAPDLATALDLPGADVRPAYALALTLLANRPRDRLGRIPAILFHQTDLDDIDVEANRRTLDAHLTRRRLHDTLKVLEDNVFKVDWPLTEPSPFASIVIPSKDNPATLKTCIDSIINQTEYKNYNIVIADNGSVQESTKSYLQSLAEIPDINIVSLPGPFNFSKINNDATHSANGEILIFLNDDTKIIAGEWLTELVSLASRPGIGAVGALLLYPNGSIQHAGVLLGVGGPADHAFRYLGGDSNGYLGLLRCRREVTAVTGACLAVSAANFHAVGGFDERLMVTCNDVDLCLRLRAIGLINIWTPWARVEHWESMSRGVDFTDEALERQAAELRIMSERWGDLMDRDPTYHPGLSDFAPNYSLSI